MELRDLPRTTDRYGRPAYLYTRDGETYRIERQAGGKTWHAIAPDDGRSLCADKPTGRTCIDDLNYLIDHWQMTAYHAALRAARLAEQEKGCTRISLPDVQPGDRVRLPALEAGRLSWWHTDVLTVDHVEQIRAGAAMLYFLLTPEQKTAGHWPFHLITGDYHAAGLLRLPAA